MSIIIKTILLYAIVVISLRLMGKRQIGELQPSELVITLLVSEIAAAPLQDEEVPLSSVLTPMITLIIFELLISVLNIKSVRFRNLLQGNSVIIIRNGEVDQKQLKRMRYSMEDVLEELRKKDIFDIKDVQYAIAETDGSISVMPKPGKRQLTPDDISLPVNEDTIPITVIDDGVIVESSLPECNMTRKRVEQIIKDKKLKKEQILLMEMTASGDITIILKKP